MELEGLTIRITIRISIPRGSNFQADRDLLRAGNNIQVSQIHRKKIPSANDLILFPFAILHNNFRCTTRKDKT